ncbi:MAG: hypothetical protein V4606_03475 [Patescibacteria group bacterium]
MKISSNIQTVLDILQNEVNGEAKEALLKMTEDYSMTWMYQSKNELFPTTSNDIESELKEVYVIKDREYDIRNICESEDVVMVEMIESYSDPKTGQIYRTPQVIVLKFKDGKIQTGRHYNDPNLSYMKLSEEQINSALINTETKLIIKSKI